MIRSITLAMALAATSAFAQDGSGEAKARTKETAQEFLTVTSETPVGYRLVQLETRDHQSSMRFVGPLGDNLCTTKMKGRESYEYHAIGIPERWERIVTENAENIVYWNLIASVTRRGPVVRVNWSNGVSPLEFGYASDDLARRAASAMEFLRLECDPTANLAF